MTKIMFLIPSDLSIQKVIITPEAVEGADPGIVRDTAHPRENLRAGHARPLPHDDIKKAQKAAAMRFLHSCGFIYTVLCAHISGVTGTAP